MLKNKLLKTLLCSMCFCTLVNTTDIIDVSAATTDSVKERVVEKDEKADAGCYLNVKKSSGIVLQQGDVFTIEYVDSSNATIYTMEQDISESQTGDIFIPLKEGEYYVSNITYSGFNKDIEKYGYGIVVNFSSRNDSTGNIVLGIGKDAVNHLVTTYNSVKIVQNGEIVSELKPFDKTADIEENTTTEVSMSETTVAETVVETTATETIIETTASNVETTMMTETTVAAETIVGTTETESETTAAEISMSEATVESEIADEDSNLVTWKELGVRILNKIPYVILSSIILGGILFFLRYKNFHD